MQGKSLGLIGIAFAGAKAVAPEQESGSILSAAMLSAPLLKGTHAIATGGTQGLHRPG